MTRCYRTLLKFEFCPIKRTAGLHHWKHFHSPYTTAGCQKSIKGPPRSTASSHSPLFYPGSHLPTTIANLTSLPRRYRYSWFRPDSYLIVVTFVFRTGRGSRSGIGLTFRHPYRALQRVRYLSYTCITVCHWAIVLWFVCVVAP